MQDWDKLSMSEKAYYIRLGMESGITDIKTIKETYNNAGRGSYQAWKQAIKEHKGIDIDKDPTYDYEGYYRSNPEHAWAFLNDDPEAHFTDKYKTAAHPSFSDESIYSGTRNKYNPTGMRGGRWMGDTRYMMSQDMLDANNYDVSKTRNYFKEAEERPMTILAPDGSIMLDTVHVTPEINPFSAGYMTENIWERAKKTKYLGEPEHRYDFTQSEEWADAHGYYPDERGHRDDRVKKPTHPTHPSRGKWNSYREYELTDKGASDVNHTLFGLADGGQDPQAVMTYKGGVVLPETTVTPKGNYIHNSYDNINIYEDGGAMKALSAISEKTPDAIKPQYWFAPKYEANNLKEAIDIAYSQNRKGKDFLWNGNAYKALMTDEEEAEFNRKTLEANRKLTNEEIVDSYLENVIYTMENPRKRGYDKKTDKWYPYKDKDIHGNKYYNYGPGISWTSGLIPRADYENEKGYTTKELNSKLRDHLLKQMNEVWEDVKAEYTKYNNTHFKDSPEKHLDPNDLPIGTRMLLLDIAHNVAPRNSRNNMPSQWPGLMDAIIENRFDDIVDEKGNVLKGVLSEARSGNTRRQYMRADLHGLSRIFKDSIRNRNRAGKIAYL